MEPFDFMIFEKVGTRKADAISKISFAAVCNLKNDIISDFRVAFGAVGPKIVRVHEIEKEINGMTVKEINKKAKWILSKYDKYITPIDDQRSNAIYRKTCSLNLLNAFISKIK